MSPAVCLLFDTRSDRLIRDLWARLEDGGVDTLASHTHGRHNPHLSYAVLRSWDLDEVRRTLARLPDGGPVAVSCQGSLLFPRGRVALAPALAGDVVKRQERVVAVLEETGADLHKNYRPGRWLPHISVATRASAGQLAAAVTAIAGMLPLVAQVERAALVDSGTGEPWSLAHIP